MPRMHFWCLLLTHKEMQLGVLGVGTYTAWAFIVGVQHPKNPPNKYFGIRDIWNIIIEPAFTVYCVLTRGITAL